MSSLGFNHDVPVGGSVFHVQTEQVQREQSIRIVTEVYDRGRVLASYRSPALEGKTDRRDLALQVRKQHKETIKWLLAGRRDSLEGALAGGKGSGSGSQFTDTRVPGPAEATGWKPKLARVVPHHSSSQDLGLRRAMIRFVRSVGRDAPTEPAQMRRRLQSLTTAIAFLLGHEGENRLRRGDLAELVMKRSEAQQFLGSRAADEGGSEIGLTLWRSFAELAQSFSAINHRSALRAHDIEALRRVLSIWLALEERSVPPDPTSLALLESCWGRDLGLDTLLDDRRGLTVAKLLPEVGRVIHELGQVET